MIEGLISIISWFSSIVNKIVNLELPFLGDTTIKYGLILMYLFYTKMAWLVIKIFLEKGHFDLIHGNGKCNGKD